MKKIIVLCLCAVFSYGNTNGSPVIQEYKEGMKEMYMVDGNGIEQLVNFEEDTSRLKSKFNAFRDVTLYVYTRNHPSTPDVISNGDLNGFKSSNFDKTKPLKFVIHGWNSNYEHVYNEIMRTAFLNAGDVNVVFVDWSKGGTALYPAACANVPEAGKFLASAIDWLVAYGVPLTNVHIVGHSLGAHVAGYAARNVKSGKVPYVTGLDPALPQWGILSKRISKNDATYVEIIHTNGRFMGIMDNIGHNDFYPNGGVLQPGCNGNLRCNHWRAFELFADSLNNEEFMSTQCNNFFVAESGTCRGSVSIKMGGLTVKPAYGVFYLPTNSQRPYSKG